jgi:hypothetical protein
VSVSIRRLDLNETDNNMIIYALGMAHGKALQDGFPALAASFVRVAEKFRVKIDARLKDPLDKIGRGADTAFWLTEPKPPST